MRDPHAEIGDDLRSRLNQRDQHTFYLGTPKQFIELMELTWRFRGPERPPYVQRGKLEVNGEMFKYLYRPRSTDNASYVSPHHVVIDYEVLEYDVKNVRFKVTSIEGSMGQKLAA